VLQGVQSNFDSDLFAPMFRFIEACSGKTYREDTQDDVSMRVIADHLRSTTFLINDGVLPSNEGRGYVLRRIMRRAAPAWEMLGLSEPFLYHGIEVVVDAMKGVYKELADHCAYITQVTLHEERRFGHTLNQGMDLLNTLIAETKRQNATVLDGREVFRLYDTFGFPLDLTQDIATDAHLHVDVEGFEREMEMQRTRARQSWKGSGEVAVETIYKELTRQLPATRFIGYDTLESSEAKILALIQNGRAVAAARTGENVGIILDVTPCYGQSGGQVGDVAVMHGQNGNGLHVEVTVSDTTKPIPELVVHHGTVAAGELRCGQTVAVAVDPVRRQRTRLNHTSTHLLQAGPA